MKDVLTIKTEAGVTYTLSPVPLPFFPSSNCEAWLKFQCCHVPNSQLPDETQDEIQRFMRYHSTEALTDGEEYYTLAGGMLSYCDPEFHTRCPS